MPTSRPRGPRRATRAPGSPNPYVVGNEAARKYLKVAEECATSRLLRLNGSAKRASLIESAHENPKPPVARRPGCRRRARVGCALGAVRRAGALDARRRSAPGAEAVQRHPFRSRARRGHGRRHDGRTACYRLRPQRRPGVGARRTVRLPAGRRPARQRYLQGRGRQDGVGIHGEGRLHRDRRRSHRHTDAQRALARAPHRPELRQPRLAGSSDLVR
jgi:hypothetical protein